jgi:Zn-dependent protease with chaperone function
MATDFFQRQDAARRRTGWLLVLYTLGMLTLTAAAYGVVLVAVWVSGGRPPSLWQPGLLALSAFGVMTVVGGGTAYKVAELAQGGGRSVAELLGGHEVPAGSQDAAERRLLNVVEEMSIASGTPMPSVYVLENEDGINAFAAGYGPTEAVVAVSRGSLEYLTRDELQGVIAHEFSHILNGDMRLNIRLIGFLHGLMLMALVGEILARVAPSSSRRSDSRGDRNNAGLAFAIAGIGLMILGWVGVLFSRLMQAAVSRQREYLADASAVQFTRNPDGIAGALKKIGGLEAGSELHAAQAKEAAHMFFASGIKQWLLDPFATHPPLDDRVRRIDPAFDGRWPVVKPLAVPLEPAHARPAAAGKPFGLPTLPGLPQVPAPVVLGLADRAGTVSQADLDLARLLHADLPPELTAAASDPFSARALVLALLLDARSEVRAAQLAAVGADPDKLLTAEVNRFADAATALPEEARLPVVDLCINPLRQMSERQYEAFRGLLRKLIEADGRISLFEYALSAVVTSALDRRFNRAVGPPRPPDGGRGPLAVLLAFLAWESAPGREKEAFAAGWEASRLTGKPDLIRRDQITLDDFDRAVRVFAAAPTRVRQSVLAGCVACVRADEQVTVREAELLRAVAALLDVPLPIGAAKPPA